MIFVDIIESLVSSFEFLFVQLYNLLIKFVSRFYLFISVELMFIELFSNIFVVLEMKLRCSSAIEHLDALLDFFEGAKFMIVSCFDSIVLHVFMLFPLILTAKCLEISFEGADIEASMAVLMLSVMFLADIIDSRKELYTLDQIFEAF